MSSTSPDYNSMWSDQLDRGLSRCGLRLTKRQCESLLDYLALVVKWNRVYNLTAIRDPAQMVSRQVLDSLSVLPYLKGSRVLDVGTGAGLPGVPLAVARPKWRFTLLDSNGKKARFVNQVRTELSLENMVVAQQRVELFRDPHGFDTVTSRAFAKLPDMLACTQHLLAPEGIWVAMKGPGEEAERKALPANISIEVIALRVPDLAGERRAVVCKRRLTTKNHYG